MRMEILRLEKERSSLSEGFGATQSSTSSDCQKEFSEARASWVKTEQLCSVLRRQLDFTQTRLNDTQHEAYSLRSTLNEESNKCIRHESEALQRIEDVTQSSSRLVAETENLRDEIIRLSSERDSALKQVTRVGSLQAHVREVQSEVFRLNDVLKSKDQKIVELDYKLNQSYELLDTSTTICNRVSVPDKSLDICSRDMKGQDLASVKSNTVVLSNALQTMNDIGVQVEILSARKFIQMSPKHHDDPRSDSDLSISYIKELTTLRNDISVISKIIDSSLNETVPFDKDCILRDVEQESIETTTDGDPGDLLIELREKVSNMRNILTNAYINNVGSEDACIIQ
eukprot:794903_1